VGARAALESVCYQTRDLLEAMRDDWTGEARPVLRVDGGMVASDWTMQCLSDMLGAPVERPTIGETTALGAAWLAGHKAGAWPDAAGFAKLWKLDRAFTPAMPAAERERKYAGWKRAIAAVLQTAQHEPGPRST
jgi:glycerol kinase